MAAPILQFKRGAFVNLPGLRAGEPALTTDTFDLYVGIDSTTNKIQSRKDSDRKLAFCLFVKQVKLLVKEHRFGVDKNGEVRVSGEGWFWALHCLHQDELIEREKPTHYF